MSHKDKVRAVICTRKSGKQFLRCLKVGGFCHKWEEHNLALSEIEKIYDARFKMVCEILENFPELKKWYSVYR